MGKSVRKRFEQEVEERGGIFMGVEDKFGKTSTTSKKW